MVSFFSNWYKKNFSDPNAVTLLVILITAFLLIYFLSGLLMPVFVAIVLAFLLEWPVNKLSHMGMGRSLATSIVVSIFVGIVLVASVGLLPVIWRQGANLLQEVPHMVSEGQNYLLTLPEKYPELVKASQIESAFGMINDKFIEWGQVALKASLNSISDIVALLIYLILVPIMIFFFLKDKSTFVNTIEGYLPNERRMAIQVGNEMHQQIMNYIRGKVIEIVIIGALSTVTFILLGLNYAVLLGVLVGLSVLVPYVGATIVTFPVMLVALFQWGVGSEFGYVMLAYGIIQAFDGNLLVPILFSEAVNLHPVTIIIAVILFGGLWGFWGVFFAIPLATLVKAVINAWSTTHPGAQSTEA
ncbi:AI-2E family transporter [Thalassotalea fusca]